MHLDPTTLIFVIVANLFATAVALPIVMGQDLSAAARFMRQAMLGKAMAWLLIAVAGRLTGTPSELLVVAVALGAMGYSNWLIFRALTLWLGPRPGGVWVVALGIALPLGYLFFLNNAAGRIAWSGLVIGMQSLALAYAHTRPHPSSSLRGNWRYLMMGCWAVLAAVSIARGLTIFGEIDAGLSIRTGSAINNLTLVVTNIALVLVGIGTLSAWREEILVELHKLIETDAMTGLLNRKGWDDRADRAMKLAKRHGHPVSILLLDLDHFKAINDTYGHEVGDDALRFFGDVLQRCQRAGDICARVGGEEFCMLLVQGNAEVGAMLDKRIRAEIARRPRDVPYALNFSAGFANARPTDTLETLMARADAAMYRAKNSGRGRLKDEYTAPAPLSP